MVKTINAPELKRMMDRREEFNLVEVLGNEEFKKRHIPGAINVPVDEIDRRAKKELDTDKKLVVYCASPECTASPNAAKKFLELGFEDVIDFDAGKKGWEDAGYEFESGSMEEEKSGTII